MPDPEAARAGTRGQLRQQVRVLAGRVRSERALGWLAAGLGTAGALTAAVLAPGAAQLALAQDWPPFALVTGLLLIGLVADDDGLFAAAGGRLARLPGGGRVLFLTAAAAIGVVTALLNLDTSVAFLTPVLVYTARGRGGGEAPLLYGSVLLANAGSLLLPGSNLTNLIVLGHLQLTGGRFFARMWLPWLASLAVTWAVIAVAERRSLRAGSAASTRAAAGPGRSDHAQRRGAEPGEPGEPGGTGPAGQPGEAGPDAPGPDAPGRPVTGVGLIAITLATVMTVTLRSPAIPVAATGAAAIGIRLAQGRDQPGHVMEVVGAPLLIGLLGVAVTLGALGRSWAGPAHLLSHLDSWATAAFAAAASVLVNNLPAASLLAAGTPGHPFALLIGLNLGPNLFVTGSLAWILWLRAARSAGARPSIARASLLGAAAVPVSMALAVGALLLTGAR
jgi:arsenical pump membrane protein